VTVGAEAYTANGIANDIRIPTVATAITSFLNMRLNSF